METTSYLKRSWNALKLNPGWWKTIIILALVSLIPIIGPIVSMGYCFRWAREAAWGIEEPMPRKMGDLGAAIKSGAIVFVSVLVWSIVIVAIYSALSIIPVVGGFLAVLALICSMAAMMVVLVMSLRGVVYDKFGPGFQIAQAWEMCRNEPAGLVKIFGIFVLFWVMQIVVAFIAIAIILIGAISTAALMFPTLFSGSSASMGHTMAHQATIFSTGIGPALVVAFIMLVLVVIFIEMLGFALASRALGYWMAQFEPAKWSGSHAGVPFGVGPQRIAKRNQEKQAKAQAAQQYAQQQYAQQQYTQQQGQAQQQYAQQQGQAQQYAQQQQGQAQQPAQAQQQDAQQPAQAQQQEAQPQQYDTEPMQQQDDQRPQPDTTDDQQQENADASVDADVTAGQTAIPMPPVADASDVQESDDGYVRGQGFVAEDTGQDSDKE